MKSYLRASMDFEALDKKIQEFVTARNSLALLAEELGLIVEHDLMCVSLEKGPTCSCNCKQGEKG